MWLRTTGPDGRQHVVPNDEALEHSFRRCICNPRVRSGVVTHRVLARKALYTPLKGGGH